VKGMSELERAQAGGGGASAAVELGRFAAEFRPEPRIGAYRTRRPRPRSMGLIGPQGYIDVFEDLPGSDAENAVGGFDEVVALASGVMTTESVGEGEAGGELFGFDEEAGAVSGPWGICFHAYQPGLKLVMNCDR